MEYDSLSDADKIMYTLGLFTHPGDIFPPPSKCEPIYQHFDDPGTDDYTVSGNIFMDGSCIRSV
eukprot:7205823-Pyramimonas_sp.AAC.1